MIESFKCRNSERKFSDQRFLIWILRDDTIYASLCTLKPNWAV